MFHRRSMIARILALGSVAMVTMGAQVSCSTGDPDLLPPIDELDEATGDGPSFTTRLILRDSSGRETQTFGRGELITFELTVFNKTAQPAVLSYSGIAGSVFVFFRSSDDPLWYPFHGVAFPAVMSQLTIPAHGTERFSFTWNQERPDGSFLMRGHYRAKGAFMTPGVFGPEYDYFSPHELAAPTRNFTVN
jgi:hypothetical protein